MGPRARSRIERIPYNSKDCVGSHGARGVCVLGVAGAVTDSFIIQISRPFCSQMLHYLWKENILGMHVKCSDNIFMSHFFAKESLTASGNSFVSLLR